MRIKNYSLSLEVLKDSGIPKRYHHTDLSSYIGDALAKERVNKYLIRFEYALEHGLGIVLYGDPNSQKTLLLTHLLKCLLAKGHFCRYFVASDLMDIEIGKKNVMGFRSAFVEPTMIGIDSVERLKTQSDFASRTFMRVLRTRADEGMPFAVATRVFPEHFNEVIGDGALQFFESYAVLVECNVDQFKFQKRRNRIKENLEC